MDEGLLNDLLECSVCLERLDTSSRVLPCQHTFCLKCLKEIVQSHKELRCPECRVPVETRPEELPPNVLLMRILEGMRNSAPRPLSQRHQPNQVPAQHGSGPAARHPEGKQVPHARAMYDYPSKEPGDLSFKKGDVIYLHKRVDAFWYRGECGGRGGIFPVAFVQVMVSLPAPAALCKALYDFRMTAPDEEGCLAFDKGAVISVLRRVDDNWAEGRMDERVGIFPIAFVELNQAARDLIHSSMVVGRAVPPVPDQQPRPGHSDHRHAQQALHHQQMTLSTPMPASPNYQHIGNMSQSHPVYHQIASTGGQVLLPQQVGSGGALVHRTMDQKPMLDLIQFANIHNKTPQTMGVQSLMRIGESYENRLRNVKYDLSAPVHHKSDKYQIAKRQEDYLISVSFNNSSDSSSSVTTPTVSVSTSAPNTTSNSSSDSTEPSSPISPENKTETNATTVLSCLATCMNTTESAENETDVSKNTSSLNESSCSTNTSLNVSLPPPTESPKKAHPESAEARKSDHSIPTADLLSLQAAASPSRVSEASYVVARQRDHRRERDKRNSLTPGTNLQAHVQHAVQNRHSAEILATSLLDHAPHDRDKERRRRRSRSGDRQLPAPYVALYPYKPHKPDELELKKGVIYTVTERCQDGWYKGCSSRTQRCGVFPGNYVAPVTRKHQDKMVVQMASPAAPKPAPQSVAPRVEAPDAPPRSGSPTPPNGQPHSFPWPSGAQPQAKSAEKGKEKSCKQEKSASGVSLMKRLAAMKKCKSPPPAGVGYSMDNPVFEDCAGHAPPQPHQPVHVRGGGEGAWPVASGVVAPSHSHRKTQSLDAGAARDHRKQPPLNERFRCIVPYPPNSEYELELRLDDVVVVHRKRADGWYKGTLERTGRTGLFPASFVQSCGTD